jgi:hypothetical protein
MKTGAQFYNTICVAVDPCPGADLFPHAGPEKSTSHILIAHIYGCDTQLHSGS